MWGAGKKKNSEQSCVAVYSHRFKANKFLKKKKKKISKAQKWNKSVFWRIKSDESVLIPHESEEREKCEEVKVTPLENADTQNQALLSAGSLLKQRIEKQQSWTEWTYCTLK